jgi:1-acyl-sn-glycerol-3-phosphate acyltransferase
MMAKEELFKKGISKWFWTSIGAFPVKRGKGDIGAIKSTLKYLKKGELVCMFPEGTRSKDGKTKKLKNGAALIASTAKVSIIPVGITADFRPFSKVTVKYGDPISFEELYGKKATKEELDEASEKPNTLPPSLNIADSKLSLVLVLGSKNKVANILPSHL